MNDRHSGNQPFPCCCIFNNQQQRRFKPRRTVGARDDISISYSEAEWKMTFTGNPILINVTLWQLSEYPLAGMPNRKEKAFP
jgi:hypothetical protein